MTNTRALIGIAVGLLLILAAFATDKAHKSEFDAAKEIVVMRNIAHQVLRYTGDSTSPISPVEKLSDTGFNIPFESAFSFKPDSLVSIIDRVIAGNRLPSKYIVNVVERKTNKVTYAYAVTGPQNIVPCTGRDQPARPYNIVIKFEQDNRFAAKGLYTGGISILSVVLLMFIATGYKKKTLIQTPEVNEIPLNAKPEIAIGRYIFAVNDMLLKLDDVETILTVKEAKILSIFAYAPNQVIDRKKLQKEIWEDEGVIVGRSLDMFISRLRKKLENDPDVKILNIHGRGYKLEIARKD